MATELADIKAFEIRLGYRFADSALLSLALTHSSAGSERNYERLEFLGDRVLALIIARQLYEAYPQETEGDLAKRHAALVAGRSLSEIAASLDLGSFLTLSEGEKAGGGKTNENILADVLEAVIGAVYLDGGLAAAEAVLLPLWQNVLKTMALPPRDPKTALQEWAQARGLPLPRYDVTSRTGPDHAPVFTIAVKVDGLSPESGEGASRRAAEKAAARKLLEKIEGCEWTGA